VKSIAAIAGLLAVGAIRAYQRCISPWLGQRCRFVPSCSEYAVEAIQTQGMLRGLALSGWRVLRCNPFNPGGLDPVSKHSTGCKCRSAHH
jgi:putative membrane protein insertion efficiency factor